MKQSRYTHAKQFNRARKTTKKLRILLGRVIRDIQRKEINPPLKLAEFLTTAQKIFTQEKFMKNKVYRVHEPHVSCISKGKAHKRYEFRCKVSIVSTSQGNWLVGAMAFDQGIATPDFVRECVRFT